MPKRFRSISPMNFLRNVRMEGAHLDLVDTACEENITEIAMKWGFYHLGRFSIGYKKRYGHSPSQTAKGLVPETECFV